MFENEVWKEIDFVNWFKFSQQLNIKYFVSNFGRIKSIDTNGKELIKSTRIKTSDKTKNKPLVFGVWVGQDKKQLDVDTCVVCAFLDPTRSYYKILYRDGNSANCELSNLDLSYDVVIDHKTLKKLIQRSIDEGVNIRSLICDILSE